MKKKSIAIVGATGLVGRELIKLLEKSSLDISKLHLFASKKSVGKKIFFKKTKIEIKELTKKSFDNIDYSFFCAGSKISHKFAKLAKDKKNIVIDNSSYFRKDTNVPLIIPEINAHLLKNHTGIIASPNCTTTIMLLAIFPLFQKHKIKRIVASTYQAASGGGKKLMDKLENDTQKFDKNNDDAFFYGYNIFLHESELSDNNYTQEEIKMIDESKKILNNQEIKISATCVRVPVLRAHSIALNIEFEEKVKMHEIINLLNNAKGIKLHNDFEKNQFATPKLASNKNDVYVSRIRQDISNENSIEMWVVGDQLLKGAALNALQIAYELNKL